MELLEKILERENLNEAYKRVYANKGASGVDGVMVEELLDYLKTNKAELLESIRTRKYKPQPVRRVEIPKDNGKKRQLGIPTVVDRVIQQAISQVLSPIYEKQFSIFPPTEQFNLKKKHTGAILRKNACRRQRRLTPWPCLFCILWCPATTRKRFFP